jgi:hypothetical protein
MSRTTFRSGFRDRKFWGDELRWGRSPCYRFWRSDALFICNVENSADASFCDAEIYNWFTEGFDTADLKDAKALLDELEA